MVLLLNPIIGFIGGTFFIPSWNTDLPIRFSFVGLSMLTLAESLDLFSCSGLSYLLIKLKFPYLKFF
jgi:hypothetical protein